jgi:hypothetical protein
MLTALLQRFSPYMDLVPRRQFGQPIVLPPASEQKDIYTLLVCWFAEAYNKALTLNIDEVFEYLRAAGSKDWSAKYEGAFAGLANLDLQEKNASWPRLTKALEQFPEQFPLINYGFGAALSHTGLDPIVHFDAIDEFWAFTALDAYGCHEAYFKWEDIFVRDAERTNMPAVAMAAYDNGIGRAIVWISEGNPDRINKLVLRFAEYRHSDLWIGVGSMTGFWGYPDVKALQRLSKLSGKYRSYLQQGIAIAAWIRCQHSVFDDYTELACREVCGGDTKELGAKVETLRQKFEHLPQTTATCQKWRDSIRSIFVDLPIS